MLGRRWRVALAVVLGLVAAAAVLQLRHPAEADTAARCAIRSEQAAERAAVTTGAGERVAVIGDSWSVGFGLPELERSWPSRLDARVQVAGFSGSGFSATASPCPGVSFADRAADAVVDGPELVVVQGGLNDFDQTPQSIEAGFSALVAGLAAYSPERVVVVGPHRAPSRASGAERVDALLERLSAQAGLRYLRPLDLDLTYLPDRLHLTEAGHRAFGDWVAEQLRG